MKKSYNWCFVLIIALGLLVSLFLNWQRYNVEMCNRTVETVADYRSIARLAHLEGKTEEEVLKLFRAKGVKTLALFDMTLKNLADKGDISLVTGSELLRARNLGTLNSTWQKIVDGSDFLPEAVYISQGTGKNTLRDVAEDIALRFGSERCRLVSQEPRIICFDGDNTLIKDYSAPGEQKGVLELELGLSTDELLLAKRLGFNVMVRPNDCADLYCAASAPAREQIAALFRRMDASGAKVTLFTPAGKATLGARKELSYVAEELQKRKINLTLVEGVTQLQFYPMAQLTDLARLMDYQAIRAYTIDKLEQKQLSFAGALRRWALSDEERNIRINYIRLFMTPQDGKTLLATNLDYVEDINKSVQKRNLALGVAKPFINYWPQPVLLLPPVMAIIAAAVLYLRLLFSMSSKEQFGLWLIATLIASFFVLKGGTAVRQALAFCSAVIFPVLSITFITHLWERPEVKERSLTNIIGAAVWQLALAVLLSLVGASLIGSILGDIRFFLEIDIYRGVKLTFILPLLLSALVFFKTHSLWQDDIPAEGVVKRISKVLRKPFTFQTLVFLGVLLFVAWVFIGRSGHTAGVPVPAFEMKLRYFLEEVMYARPREKEFLIGHPAFFLAAYAAYKKLPNMLYFLFVVAATIGQASLVQTFAHMRTPIIMSYVRAVDGWVMGLLFGVVALLVFDLLCPYLLKWYREIMSDE